MGGGAGRTRRGRGASSTGSSCTTTARIFAGLDSTCSRPEGNSMLVLVNDGETSRATGEGSRSGDSNGVGADGGSDSSATAGAKSGSGLRGSASSASGTRVVGARSATSKALTSAGAAGSCVPPAWSGASNALTSTGPAGSGSTFGTATAAARAAAESSSIWVAGGTDGNGAWCGACGIWVPAASACSRCSWRPRPLRRRRPRPSRCSPGSRAGGWP
jgi:hypothetical protein